MCNECFFTTRRQFLGGSLSLLSAAATVPLFLKSAATVLGQSASRPGRKNDSDRILVVVQLAGGNDGLNTVIPYEADSYYQLRPRLAIAKDKVLHLQKGLGLHPGLGGFKSLYDEGRMAIVQGVGYPNPNRSHFVSMDIWHSADPAQRARSGWIGRYFDAQCKGDDPAPEPIRGIALMTESPLAMQGEQFAPLSFQDAAALAWRTPRGDRTAEAAFRTLNNRDGTFSDTGSDTMQFLQRAALEAQVGADEIHEAINGQTPRARRRGGARRAGGGALRQQLQAVANMIAADLPTRVFYVSLGGFDTHSGQLQTHNNLMAELGAAMQSFIETLEKDGLLERVLVLTFSEFGRRVQENASGGTDHGEAAPVFLFGAAVKPGLHGEHPDLRNLNRGDLAHTTDFRRVYAAVLRDWLRVPTQPILGSGFGPLPLLRG